MLKRMMNLSYVAICGVLIFQLIGCGTILYPERKGQKSGRIDIGIALLDGVGLFLFLIPGIIAYAVDFNNGTIYLPNTLRGSLNMKNIKQVKFDPKHTSLASIQDMIKKESGVDVTLSEKNTQITKLISVKDMMNQFAKVQSDNQLVSNK